MKRRPWKSYFLLSLLSSWLSITSSFSLFPLSIRSSTQLHGVLSRSAILSSVKRATNNQKPSQSQEPPKWTQTYTSAAVKEALFRQDRILQSLQRQDHQNSPAVLERLQHVTETKQRLIQLRQSISSTTYSRVGDELIKMGFESLLSNPSLWKWTREKEYGRPSGFGGLIFYYQDIPILIGRHGAHSDETMRQTAQGADLWLQVSDYQGSRVLIRYSLAKGQKDNRNALALAANLAAYFSDHRTEEEVAVIYTHSKLVAKRGSRKGKMKRSKSLGTLIGRPKDVASLVDGQEP